VFPLRSIPRLVSPASCHQHPGRLSSSSSGLQSLRVSMPGTVLVGCCHLDLSSREALVFVAFGLEPDGSTQKSIRLPLLPLGLTSRVPLESALPRPLALQASPRTASILPWGCVALRRFQSRAATYTGLSNTRLSSALGVSHPLDALLRSKPSRPCFMPVTPLSFCLQRVSPPFDRFASRRSNPSCRLPATPTIAWDLAVFIDVRRHSRGSKGVSHPVIRA
jgi:hypothetical protein